MDLSCLFPSDRSGNRHVLNTGRVPRGHPLLPHNPVLLFALYPSACHRHCAPTVPRIDCIKRGHQTRFVEGFMGLDIQVLNEYEIYCLGANGHKGVSP